MLTLRARMQFLYLCEVLMKIKNKNIHLKRGVVTNKIYVWEESKQWNPPCHSNVTALNV